MLGGHDQGGRAHGHSILILKRDLALGVGLEEIDHFPVPIERHPLEDAVRIIEGGGKEIGRLVGRVAEHDALIARALVLVAAFIDAHRDVRGLTVKVAGEFRILPMEAALLVADLLDRIAHHLLDLGLGRGHVLAAADLAGEHDPVGGDHRLAGDARFRIAADEQVHDRIGNLVRNLVGMAFGNGFRREDVIAAHRGKSPSAGWGIRI
jgi:hypothetical protein